MSMITPIQVPVLAHLIVHIHYQLQTLTSSNGKRIYIDDCHYQFLGNYATKSGMGLYGGLLDRCTVSPITDLMFTYLDNDDNHL